MATVKESETLKLKIERLKFDQSEQKRQNFFVLIGEISIFNL